MATVVTMLIGSPSANALLLKDNTNNSSGNIGGGAGAKASTPTNNGPAKPFLGQSQNQNQTNGASKSITDNSGMASLDNAIKNIDNMKNNAINNLDSMNKTKPNTNTAAGPVNKQQSQPSNISNSSNQKDDNTEGLKDLGKSMMGALSKSLKENAAAKETSKDKDSDDMVEEMTKKQKKVSSAKKQQ